MKNICRFIVMLLCLFTTQTFAGDCPKKDILQQLHILGDESILAIEESRFYLNPEKIYVDQNGIYLNSESFGPLRLANLVQDKKGTYTLDLYCVYMCDDCSSIYYYEPSECSICGGTSFTLLDQLGD